MTTCSVPNSGAVLWGRQGREARPLKKSRPLWPLKVRSLAFSGADIEFDCTSKFYYSTFSLSCDCEIPVLPIHTVLKDSCKQYIALIGSKSDIRVYGVPGMRPPFEILAPTTVPDSKILEPPLPAMRHRQRLVIQNYFTTADAQIVVKRHNPHQCCNKSFQWSIYKIPRLYKRWTDGRLR